MTEPDKAILWARRWRSDNLQALGLPSLAQRVADGETDETLEGFARAYRAGQAASAERIKALEGLVQNLMLEARARTKRSNPPVVTNIVKMTVPDRVALIKEADQ